MIVDPPADGSSSPLIENLRCYRLALEEAISDADRLVFNPTMDGFDIHADEFDQLLFLQGRIEDIAAVVQVHAEEVGLLLSEAVTRAGGMVITKLGVALTVDENDGSVTAVGITDDHADADCSPPDN